MTMNQSKLLNGKIESSKLKKLVTLYGEIQNEIKNGKCVIPKVCSNCLEEFDERGQERVSVRVCGISSDLDRGLGHEQMICYKSLSSAMPSTSDTHVR